MNVYIITQPFEEVRPKIAKLEYDATLCVLESIKALFSEILKELIIYSLLVFVCYTPYEAFEIYNSLTKVYSNFRSIFSKELREKVIKVIRVDYYPSVLIDEKNYSDYNIYINNKSFSLIKDENNRWWIIKDVVIFNKRKYVTKDELHLPFKEFIEFELKRLR